MVSRLVPVLMLLLGEHFTVVYAYTCGSNFQLGYGSAAYLQSPYYPSNYGNNVDCYSTVSAPGTNDRIYVDFQSFITEHCCDYLDIDGNNYRGEGGVSDFWSTGNILNLRFHTDGSVVYSGFYIRLETADTTPPQITGCPSNIPTTTELGTAITVNWNEPSATDQSGTPQRTRSHSPNTQFSSGVTTVHYYFIDTSSNTATCTFEVTVQTVDTTSPLITGCPSHNIYATHELGSAETVLVTWNEPSATDPSGTPARTRSHSPSTDFPVGVTTVRYSYTDTSDNTAICSFQVIVETADTTPPRIVHCPVDIHSIPGRHIAWIEPTAIDISGNVTKTGSHAPGMYVIQTTKIVYTFSDSSANLGFCNFTVNVYQDTVQPIVIGCPSDIHASAEIGEQGISVSWIKPTATDESGRVMLIDFTHTSGERFSVGSTSVMYTFADDSFNKAYCNFSVIIQQVDTTPPTIYSCPSETFKEIEFGTPNTAVYWNTPTATDLSGNVSLVSQSHFPGESFTVGKTVVSYVFSDGSENEKACEFNIVSREVDTTPPSIEYCPEDITETIEMGATTATVAWTEPRATDLSGNVTLSSRSRIPTLFSPYAETVVRYVFMDNSNNEKVCEFYVSFDTVDTTPPSIISCPSDIYKTVEKGTSYSSIWWSTPLATDYSGLVITHATHEPGQSFRVGLTTVVYHFEDESANQAECNFTVIVENVDTTPPDILFCPVDIIETVELGVSRKAVFWPELSVSDISGTVFTSQSHFSGEYFTIGKTDVNYTFVDDTGNGASCNFSIILASVDTTEPAISMCPSDITTTIEVGTIGSVVSWTEPIAMDESGNTTLLVNTHSPGQRFGTGPTTVTYIFVDNSKNMAICRFIININSEDTTPPKIVGCPPDIHVPAEIGTSQIPVSWIEPFALDASSDVKLIDVTHAPGDNFTIGSTPVTYKFVDDSANNASCEFTVAVSLKDTTSPMIVGCPSDIHVLAEISTSQIPVSWIEPIALDASGHVRLIDVTHTPGDNFTIGSTTVMYTFIDDSANSASCEFMVAVSPRTTTRVKIVGCPTDIHVTVEIGTSQIPVSWIEPLASDASGHVRRIGVTHTPGDNFTIGSTPVVYTFVDDSDNSASCEFMVAVSLIDTKAPTIKNCPSNIITNIEQGTYGSAVYWDEPEVMDESGGVSLLVQSHSPGAYFPVGTTMVTYLYKDHTNNIASCMFSVIGSTDPLQSDNSAALKVNNPMIPNDVVLWISVSALGLTLLAWVVGGCIVMYIRHKEDSEAIGQRSQRMSDSSIAMDNVSTF